LLELTPEILNHLSAAGTLVVPSPQRAAALRLAYSAAQLSAGRRVWNSPDVLPWGAWLERGLDEARARAVPVPRRLSRAEEWLLWREAVRAACADLPVLSPDSLIDSVRRAVLLLEDYALVLHEASSPEAAVLLRARAHFQQRCAELRALWSGSWSACAPYVRPITPTLLSGFAPLAPARRSWLERIDVRIGQSDGRGDESGTLQVRDFDNPELEAEAAAQWCAWQLERDPGARVLLVVLRLGEQRHRWLRALSRRLDYRSLLAPGATLARSALAIEGGQPLRDYSLIATALNLLALSAGVADFQMLSALLRSPFLDLPGRESRLRIDLWLRERNIDGAQPSLLQTLTAPLSDDLGEGDALALSALIAALTAGAPAAAPRHYVASPAQWAQRFAQVLAGCGWPGAGLNSDEQQVRARFDELLGEFAGISIVPGALSQAQALQILRQLTARTAFEPASDDVPVTVTASLDDPIVHYDAIWVAGMTAEAWPQAAHPDPLVPWALQQAAAMPMASPAGMLQAAERALRHWRRASSRLDLSWSRSDGDMPHDPSPLLAETALAAPAPAPEHPAAASFQFQSWLAASAPPLEGWRDSSGPAWPRERVLHGGTRLLELQSLCPFRGFAVLRLRAQPLPEPAPGIDLRVRGQILHHALELFWRATGSLAQLRERPEAATLRLVSSCVERALAQAAQRAPMCMEPSELHREGERAVQLLLRLIDWELKREPFEIAQLEWPQPYAVAGASLQLRLDRVDRLADGRLLVIDYKSGVASPFDALAERPMLPQLPAYAVAAGEQTAAVLSLYLGREGPKLRGIADKPGRLPGLRALQAGEAHWPALLQRWREQLHRLVQEFLSGYAVVQPQPGACDSCHLQSFCRIQLTAVLPP
jgi:ATP-dependent helicase/nuclease subunit B